ncbi:hypothetical protein Tco_0896616 [Tanacetum coccineum]
MVRNNSNNNAPLDDSSPLIRASSNPNRFIKLQREMVSVTINMTGVISPWIWKEPIKEECSGGCLATRLIDLNVGKGGGLVDLEGEDSLDEEILMMLMQAIIFGGFLVDEEGLEGLVIFVWVKVDCGKRQGKDDTFQWDHFCHEIVMKKRSRWVDEAFSINHESFYTSLGEGYHDMV